MADFSIITPRLVTGAAVRNINDVAELFNNGVRAVIDCCAEMDDALLLSSHPGFTYLWNGVWDDGTLKPVGWFSKSINFALEAMKGSGKVYAHCAAGVNRGPSTAFAIMLACGWTPAEAEAIIRAARPQVGLAYKGDAIAAITALGMLE